MNTREVEQLKKKSIFSIEFNSKLKDSLIQININDLSRFLKQTTKRKQLLVIVLENES
jgi:hypothetical protein